MLVYERFERPYVL